MKLSQIFIYPIKGCKGISVNNALLEIRGLKHDRRFMLIDQDGKFISQRNDARLTAIQCELKDQLLIVNFLTESIMIPLDQAYDKPVASVVWDDRIKAYETKDSYDQWFSKILNTQVRLVAMQDDSHRPVDARFAQSKNDEVSFADGYPYLVIGEASLKLLNDKLGQEDDLLIDRFRPNLVFSDGNPHEEDTWGEFMIGDANFYGVKPCARCQVTTINQQTGEQGKEPLKILSSYRKIGNKILFGQNVLLKSGRKVEVGDEIIVHQYIKDPMS